MRGPYFYQWSMLTLHQGSRKCDDDGSSTAHRWDRRGSKQTLQICECPNKEQITSLKSVLVWCHPRGATENKNCCDGRILLQSKSSEWLIAVTPYSVHIQESVLPTLSKDKEWTHDEEIAISVTWRSTLYVTNFGEGMDDTQIREMFSKVR